ncbi:MAG: hypothetical protein Q4G57_01165, partial [Bacillota bacterium]|nr:hypothetical protein [Bacillota bacterium]
MKEEISEGMFFVVFLVTFVLLVQIFCSIRAKRNEAALLARLSVNFGKIPDKKMSPERYSKVPAYYLRHRPEDEIDDITWNDLDMDLIYHRMDSTQSAAGEEYLYALLRSPASGVPGKDRLQIPAETIRYFEEEKNRSVRTGLVASLHRFGHAGKYS